MKKKTPKSLILTEICIYILAAAMLFVDIFLYPITGWYLELRAITDASIRTVLVVALYVESFFGWFLLVELYRLIRNIKRENVFVAQNVAILRVVSYLTLAIGVVGVIAGIKYLPFLFLAVAALFITLIVRVIKNVFQQAIEMKDELDYTV